MKKILNLLLVSVLCLTLISCKNNSSSSTPQANDDTITKRVEEIATSYDIEKIGSIVVAMDKTNEKTEDLLERNANSIIRDLGTSYESYMNNKDKITKFYEDSLLTTKALHSFYKKATKDSLLNVSKMDLNNKDLLKSVFLPFTDEYMEDMDDLLEEINDTYEDNYETSLRLINKQGDTNALAAMQKEHTDALKAIRDLHNNNYIELTNIHTDAYNTLFNGNTDISNILKKLDE